MNERRPQWLKPRLSLLMFFQFAIWGSWFVTAGTYLIKGLGFSGFQVGLLYGTTAVAATISPFLIGRIADQWIDIKYLLALLHGLGGFIMLWLTQIESFAIFYPMLQIYTILYMPTFALSSSITFHHATNPTRDFSQIRVWGTIAWILMGLIISALDLEETKTPLVLSGTISLIHSLYCLSLPSIERDFTAKTPEIFSPEVKKIFNAPGFKILIIALLLTSIPSAYYYSFTNIFLIEHGIDNAAGIMSLGQITEIIFMLTLPFFIAQFGLKRLLVIGIFTWGFRYALFAIDYEVKWYTLTYVGVGLHGLAYSFSFLLGQIYVDQIVPKHLKSTAQGIVTLITLGIGVLIGSIVAGQSVALLTNKPIEHQWSWIWSIPALVGMMTAVWLNFKLTDQLGDRKNQE